MSEPAVSYHLLHTGFFDLGKFNAKVAKKQRRKEEKIHTKSRKFMMQTVCPMPISLFYLCAFASLLPLR